MTHHKFIKHLTEKYTEGKTLGLDIGSGYDNWKPFKKCKFINIDKIQKEGVDIVHDLNTELPFDFDTFDVVLCYNVLEYIQNDGLLLKEIHRVIKPNGVFVLVTQNKLYPQGWINEMITFAGFHSLFIKNLRDWFKAIWYNNTSVYAFMVSDPCKTRLV